MDRTARGAALLVGVMLVALSACSALPGSPERQAAALAEDKAKAAHRRVELSSGNPPIENMVHVVGEFGEVLAAEGDEWNGGARIVLRTTASVRTVGGTDVVSTRCFKLTWKKGERWDRSTKAIDCPDTEPIELPTTTTSPKLPDGALEALRGVLEPMVGTGAGVDEVTTAARSVMPDATLSVDEVDGVIGVAGLATGRMNRDCVYARLAPDGLEVWYPPRIYLSPGEAACAADEAISRRTQRPPH